MLRSETVDSQTEVQDKVMADAVCTEPAVLHTRDTFYIKGFNVSDIEHKRSFCADDRVLLLMESDQLVPH